TVRIAAATHQRRDRRRGGASAGEYLGAAGDGFGLARREPQRVVVRAERISVPAGAGQRLAHGHVAPWILGLELDVALEQPQRCEVVARELGETIGRV